MLCLHSYGYLKVSDSGRSSAEIIPVWVTCFIFSIILIHLSGNPLFRNRWKPLTEGQIVAKLSTM